MKITKRQLRRIIKEQMMPTQVRVEWDLGDHDPLEGFEDLPQIVDIPSNVMAQYESEIAEYGEVDAASVISDWLDDTFGWLSQWEFIGPRQLRETLNTHNMDPNKAYELIAILQEFGYELFLPPAMDSNNIAIDDALAGYPGEFTYDELMTAVRVVQGRGA